LTNARSILAAARRDEIWALHEEGLSNRATAAEIGVSRSTVGRHIAAMRAEREDAPPSAPSRPVDERAAAEHRERHLEATERQREQQRPLDIECGLAYFALFGELPNTDSWNATNCRTTGPAPFFCHEFPFLSRLDGRWHPWPSPQRIERDFPASYPADRGLDAFNRIVVKTWLTLKRQGTPYVPLAFRESVFDAALQAASRASITDPAMTVPGVLRCSSLRKDRAGRENPARFGSTSWGPIGIPRVAERGLCVIASFDFWRRFECVRKTVLADLVDDGAGICITSTPTAVVIRSRHGSIPAIQRLNVPQVRASPHGSVLIHEPSEATTHAPGNRARVERPALLDVLRWVLDCRDDLIATGTLSILIAEAQAGGRSILPQLGAFLGLWTARHAPSDAETIAAALDRAVAGDEPALAADLAALNRPLSASGLAVVAVIEPCGSEDERCLYDLATCGFDFLAEEGIDRTATYRPGTGLEAKHLEAIRDALRKA